MSAPPRSDHAAASGRVASPPSGGYVLFMADDPKPSQKALREQRLEAALRENLKRRKAQARGGAEEEPAEPGPDEAGPSAPDFRRNPGGKLAPDKG